MAPWRVAVLCVLAPWVLVPLMVGAQPARQVSVVTAPFRIMNAQGQRLMQVDAAPRGSRLTLYTVQPDGTEVATVAIIATALGGGLSLDNARGSPAVFCGTMGLPEFREGEQAKLGGGYVQVYNSAGRRVGAMSSDIDDASRATLELASPSGRAIEMNVSKSDGSITVFDSRGRARYRRP